MNVPGVDTIFSPLDVAWELDEGNFSGALKQNMVWLCGVLPYEQAAQVMARIGKRNVSDSSLWRMAQHADQWINQPTDEVRKTPTVPNRASAEVTTKLLSMDGGMVNIFGEGWKELKVVLVGNIVVEEPDSSDRLPSVHTQPLRYGAVLGDIAAFTPVLRNIATNAGFGEATRSCITADGAPWIWNLADTHFPASVQILDWYHARQHLSDAAQALFPDLPTRAATWFQTRTDDLFEGQLTPIVLELENAGLAEPAAYFSTHAPRMHYADFQDAGYPIGSGSVESEVKQFKHRLAGPGMSWSRQGIQHLIRIRAAVLDGSFDSCWSQVA
jgi:hypothetical protein